MHKHMCVYSEQLADHVAHKFGVPKYHIQVVVAGVGGNRGAFPS